ncbi:MAG: LamG domain-containing protein [Victivallaceae bacterium]
MGGHWVKGGFGYAMRFAGGNDSIRIERSKILEPGIFSLECWFSPDITIDKNLPDFGYLFMKTLPRKGYFLCFRKKWGVLGFAVGTGASGSRGAYTKTSEWKAKKWYYVVCTYDGSNAKLYVNGNLESTTQVGQMTPSGNILSMGAGFKGIIGQAKIWNTVLTDKMIVKMYKEGKNKIAEEVKLVGEKIERTNNSGEAGQNAKASWIYRARLNGTEFIVPDKTAFLRSYRRLSAEPLIDFISIAEEDKAQCSLTGLKWKYYWQKSSATIIKGKTTYKDSPLKDNNWYSPRHLQGCRQIVFGSNGEATEFQTKGKLCNAWSQTFSWEEHVLKNENLKILNIDWERKLTEISAVQAIIRLPRTLPVEAYIKTAGKTVKLEDGAKINLGKGKVISIPCPTQASLLDISFDLPGKIELLKPRSMEKLLGGWSLRFIPEDAESIKRFSLKLADHAYRKLNGNGVEIATNMESGSYSAFAGGMPLFQIYGTEQHAVQGPAGNWKTTILGKENNFYLKSIGKIVSDWKSVCRITPKKIIFDFQKEKAFQDSGIMIRIPYVWVSSRYLVRRFTEKAAMTGIVPPYAADQALNNLTCEEASGSCPLKIGACIDLGIFPANSRLEWFPTESEKVSFIFRRDCRVVAGRFRQALYNPPFDLTTLPTWSNMVSSSEKHGAIALNLPAFFNLHPVEKNARGVAVECLYERLGNGGTALPGKNRVSPGNNDITCTKQGTTVLVTTPYWQVTHDVTRGGVPTGIVFPQGLNENILKAPISSYIMGGTDKIIRESDSGNVNIKTEKMKDGKIKLVVHGKLGSTKLPFTTEYIYDRGGLRRNLTLDFSKVPLEIKTLGVVRIETAPWLDHAKYKPCLMKYVKAVFPGPAVTQGVRMHLGVMGLYHQNGEGIDLTPASDIWRWYVLGENKGFFAIEGNNANPVIIAEALHIEKCVKVDKKLSFEHYIGLPEAKNPAPKKWRPCGISEPQWVTGNDKVVKSFSENGINVAMSPICNAGFGWYYKPLPPACWEAGVKLAQNGIFPLPFFAPSCFVKKCGELDKNIEKWTMGKFVNGKYKPAWAGPYLMGCYESAGLTEFMKKGYKHVMNNYPHHGIYCDFIYPLGPCNNPSHARIPHIGMDGLLDFCSWIKKELLQKDQIFYAHTGYCPVYNVESYCDLAFTWEEMNYWYNYEGRPVSLARVSECGVQSSNLQRALDPHAMFSWIKRNGEPLGRVRHLPEDCQALTTRMALNGVFPLLHTGMLCPVSAQDLLNKAKSFLKLAKAFRGIPLSEYHFMDWKTQNTVLTDDPYVKTAVYFKPGSLIIVMGVPEDYRKHKFNWKVSESFIKQLKLRHKLTIKNNLTGNSNNIPSSQLGKNGINTELDGFDFTVVNISAL